MNTASKMLIENAVVLIEKNLKNNLTLDEISLQLNISKFHLHRLFRAITGIPLISYVRGRKLTSSLAELQDEKLKIIDIACEYHFEYEQSYERAFKQLFKITPSAYRQKNCELPIIPKIDTNLLNDISKGILIAPRYCTKPAFYLAGIRTLINHVQNYDCSTANSNGLDFYFNQKSLLKNMINESVYYGLVTYHESIELDYYMPGVEVANPFFNDTLFTCEKIERSDYAVFRYVGLHSPTELNIKLLYEVYRAIETIWLPNTSLNPSGEFHFERIDQKMCRDDYCEADIYYPIKSSIVP